MSQRSRHKMWRQYREPTREELRLIRGVENLEFIFNETEMAELLDRARRRIVSVVHHSTEWRRGKYRRTDNYIIGVAGGQKHLAHHVLRALRRAFVHEQDLPEGVGELHPSDIRSIVSDVEYRLILAQINQMVKDADVWYDEATGIWQTSQRCHDIRTSEVKKAKRAFKFDRREWHGRPRRQARNRDVREGDSISYGRMR